VRGGRLRHAVELVDGTTATALDLQWQYLDWVSKHAAVHGVSTVESSVIESWEEILTDLERSPASTADRLDWTAKLSLLDGYRDRDQLGWAAPKLRLAGLQYHDVDRTRSLYRRLVDAGRMRTLFTEEQVIRATTAPPERTRAWFRGACIERYGRIDILHNNAGITGGSGGPVETSEETWDRVLDTNLKGTFLVAQAAARRMVRRRRGVIITLSSVNAEVVRPESAAYGASKGGVRQLTKAMGISLAPYGVRVNAIGPGTVVTGLTRHLLRKKAWRDAVFMRTPMQRVADPREIAEVAVFLASDASSYMTGSTVYVDGGRLALNGLMPLRKGR